MTAANVNVRPAAAPGIVAPNASNLVLLFALDPIPVSAQRLVCHWHRDADSRLVCAWIYPPIPHPRSERTCPAVSTRGGSSIVPA
jgi:hypothetical protein